MFTANGKTSGWNLLSMIPKTQWNLFNFGQVIIFMCWEQWQSITWLQVSCRMTPHQMSMEGLFFLHSQQLSHKRQWRWKVQLLWPKPKRIDSLVVQSGITNRRQMPGWQLRTKCTQRSWSKPSPKLNCVWMETGSHEGVPTIAMRG